jgi:hypothetical protein
LDAAEQIEQARVQERIEARSMTSLVRELRAELVATRRLSAFYAALTDAATPIRVPTWRVRPKPGRGSHGLVVAQMTDWHLDEVVQPEEIGYLNAFNADIALKRIRRWTEKVITLPRTYMNGLTIDGLVIPATGDLFTGEIHAELRESNERHLMETLVHWQAPVLASLEMLASEYADVEVNAVVGNHGRLTTKPVFKGRVHDNVEWLFWSVIRERLADRGRSNIHVNLSPSMDMNVPIYGRNHLLTHGDQFRGGSGISGAFAPLSLGAHRKGKRQSIAGLPMETMVIGHLHQLINIPGVIMGGSLKGLDEFAYGINAAPDPNGAAQALWVTAPERAQVMWMPVYVQDRKAEGW